MSELQNATSTIGFIHPLYDQSTVPRTSDIGIIILLAPLVSTHPDYQPGPISLPESMMELPRLNEEGTIVGLSTGQEGILYPNATLKSAYLMVTPKNNCSSQSEDTFCAAHEYYDANVCHSDSGSAFALHYRGGIVLVRFFFEAFRCLDINEHDFSIGWYDYGSIELL